MFLSIFYTLLVMSTSGEDGFQCGFDTLSVDELFKGNMPDWLPDDYATSTLLLLQYYEVMSPSLLFNSFFLLLILIIYFSDERIRGGTSQRMASYLR